MSSVGFVEPVLAERHRHLVQRHERGHEVLDRLHVLGVADAEDHVAAPRTRLASPDGGTPDHVAHDLERQRRRDLGDEVALALLGDRVDHRRRADLHLVEDLVRAPSG